MVADLFSHVATWVLDLDDTLYAPKVWLFDRIARRMTAWIARSAGVDAAAMFEDDARNLAAPHAMDLRRVHVIPAPDPHIHYHTDDLPGGPVGTRGPVTQHTGSARGAALSDKRGPRRE